MARTEKGQRNNMLLILVLKMEEPLYYFKHTDRVIKMLEGESVPLQGIG